MVNFKRISKFFLSSLAVVCSFVACANKVEVTQNDCAIQTKNTSFYSNDKNIYENGLLYSTNISATTMTYFLDFDSMQSVPLCNMPNCTHSSGTCLASLCSASGNTPIVYRDYVYYFTETEEIVDDSENESTDYQITSICHRASLSQGTTEIFAEFENDATYTSNVILSNDMLYFTTSDGALQLENGDWVCIPGSGPQYLCSLNLETGVFQQIAQMNDASNAENNRIVTENSVNAVLTDVMIQGIYQNKIYIEYQYIEDPQELIDALDQDDVFGETVAWSYTVKTYDVETGEIADSGFPHSAAIDEDIYVYWDENTEQFIVNMSDGTEISLELFSETSSIDIVNGKIWDTLETMQCFDLETQTMYTITNETYTDGSAVVLDYIDGEYIVEYYDESGTLCFDKVSESDLIRDN